MKRFVRLPYYQAAFTLIELIVTVILLAIVGSYVFVRFSSSNSYKLDTIVEQLISASQLTQQLSMNDTSRAFSLNIQSNQINLLVDGVSFSAGGMDFPLVFDSNVVLSPTPTISFDSLGTTSNAVINVQLGNSQNVCFETNGFIHRC